MSWALLAWLANVGQQQRQRQRGPAGAGGGQPQRRWGGAKQAARRSLARAPMLLSPPTHAALPTHPPWSCSTDFEGFSSDETVRVVMSGNQEPRSVDITQEAYAQVGGPGVARRVGEWMGAHGMGGGHACCRWRRRCPAAATLQLSLEPRWRPPPPPRDTGRGGAQRAGGGGDEGGSLQERGRHEGAHAQAGIQPGHAAAAQLAQLPARSATAPSLSRLPRSILQLPSCQQF